MTEYRVRRLYDPTELEIEKTLNSFTNDGWTLDSWGYCNTFRLDIVFRHDIVPEPVPVIGPLPRKKVKA